ncbi:MAG: ferric reductase-like transmembrane domain-containing protein [Kiloniellaceae bacterium]
MTLSPLALAWVGARPPRSFWDELATGAGMLAFAIILVEFVLSGRFRTVSGRIGMDVTMRAHQLLARSALVLALVHPFLYTTGFNPPLPWDDTRQATLTADFAALATGVLAWVLLPVFVLLSIGRDRIGYSYETWRWMHGLGALLIAGLLLHHVLAAGRYSGDPLLAVLWSGLFAIAVLSLVNVYIVKPLLQRRRPWRVTGVRPVALKTWELTLQPEGHTGLGYKAGQFVWLNVGNSPFSLHENPFSISSAPGGEPDLQFVIKELGDFTRGVGAIAPGTPAHLDGPHGTLVVAGVDASGQDAPGHEARGIALIAGGVGVAPLLGILRQLRHDADPRPSLLVYGNRIAEQIAYREELEDLARAQGTRVIHVLSEPPAGWTGPVGMVDAALIREIFAAPEMKGWLYVLCGPPVMMEGVEDCLIECGVPARRILSERFSYD